MYTVCSLSGHPTSASAIIRDAVATDLDALVSLRPTRALHKDRVNEANKGTMRYLVTEFSGVVVGFGILAFEDLSTSDQPLPYHPMAIDLFVAPEFRSRGIGTAMLQFMEDEATRRGFTAMFLSVEPEANPRAYALYRRLQYEPLQTEPYEDRYRFVDSDGNVHEGVEWCVDMRKSLQ